MSEHSVKKAFLSSVLVVGCGVAFAAVEDVPSVRALTEEDFAAGVALVRIGTNERFDFTAPDGAEVCADWAAFGAARDWFSNHFGERTGAEGGPWTFVKGTNTVGSFTVFSYGTVRPSVRDVQTCVSPLEAVMGIVPASSHGVLRAENSPSCFWQYFTPSNTLQLTWQNVLLDRDVRKPVSFQVEIDRDGNMVFRYDLSRLESEVVTNLSVGVLNDGHGRIFTALPRNTTSLRWAYLDPALGAAEDHDGDGVSTADEVFLFGTNPYSVDTDRDGLPDGLEIHASPTNPKDAYSADSRFVDSIARALDGVDPFSRPNDDGRTAFENAFYTGSAFGRGGEPEANSDWAVLEVSAWGRNGRGAVSVGGKIVPLLPGAKPLKVAVPRRVVIQLVNDCEDEVTPVFDSSEYCIGEVPFNLKGKGWIVFPNVEPTHACIHVTDEKSVTVSLDPGEGIDDLVCTWRSDDESIEVNNRPPLSAELTAGFARDSTDRVIYELSHPKHLFGERFYEQVCEYCPKIFDEPDYSSTEDYPDESGCSELYACWCYEHRCYDYVCAYLHHGATGGDDTLCWPWYGVTNNLYSTATNSPNQYADVLKFRRPVEAYESSNARLIDVVVPADKYKCCQCEEHWKGQATIDYKSRNVAVHLDGQPFCRTTTNCTLEVFGVGPSSEIGDSVVSILTNGEEYALFEYTVLGVGIGVDGVDLKRLNALSPSFGLPVLVNTNFENATKIVLYNDVNLPDGTIRLAFENPTARMQLWMSYQPYFEQREVHLLLLDSETCPEVELPIADWRRMVANVTRDRDTTLQLLTYGHGSARLFFGYAGAQDGMYLHDEATQMITCIRPPLLPDYNRDGKIDDEDEKAYLNGKPVYFWVNEDSWKGDDAFENGLFDKCNIKDDKVNGRYDAINYLPMIIDFTDFPSGWNSDAYKIELRTDNEEMRGSKYCIVNISAKEIGLVAEGDCLTLDGVPMRDAQVHDLGSFAVLPGEVAHGDERGVHAVAIEFPNEVIGGNLRIAIVSRDTGEIIFSQIISLNVSKVDDMYGWVNLRRLVGNCEGDLTSLSTEGWPTTEHKEGNVVFAHGYNVTKDEARTWSRGVFKKLWWSGLNRGFIAVTWYGNEGQVLGKMTPNYYGNVQNAFESASHYKEEMDKIPGPKWFIAHSLGNMLTSAAIQDFSMKYEKYFMLNAAVAMEAFDADKGITKDSHDNMTPTEWLEYGDRVRATHWYELFPEGDGRRLLTWKGRFSNVTNIVNFYSSEEEVLNDGDSKMHPLVERLYVWYNQETRKGSWPLMLHEYEGGWVFNTYYDVVLGYWLMNEYMEDKKHLQPAEANELSSEQLRMRPFFLDFYDSDMYSSSDGRIVRDNYSYRAEMLGYAIPAESYAVGAHPLPQLNARTNNWGEVSRSANFDMAALFRNGVEDLSKSEGLNNQAWQHSTFAQRSYKRTKQLFKQIVDYIKESDDEKDCE